MSRGAGSGDSSPQRNSTTTATGEHSGDRTGETVMNTYDPADGIVYVHMAPQSDPWSLPVIEARRCNTLPTGYANRSPRTRLRSDTRSARVPSLLARRTA
jgi:hypothetical protein